MTENDLYTILQRDDNLREAIRRREQKQPTMPADLKEKPLPKGGENQEPSLACCRLPAHHHWHRCSINAIKRKPQFWRICNSTGWSRGFEIPGSNKESSDCKS